MRVAVLVKQVPQAETLALLPDGRLRRQGVDLEMNAYCRRAVSKGVELAAAAGGRCVVLTLGPPAAEDVLREAVAWGADEGVLVTDPAFAGSDTLATARALAAALRREGPWDLVLTGRNSIDADTGQVPPQVAQLLGLPFVAGVRQLAQPDAGHLDLTCELDDGWRTVQVALPCVLSTAERLTEPAKVPPEGRAGVDPARIRRLQAADLGPGPWGEAASPTRVGPIRQLTLSRHGVVLHGDPAEQVARAADLLTEWGALTGRAGHRATATADADGAVPAAAGPADGPEVAVVIEPDRPRAARELLGEAAVLAAATGGRVTAVGPDLPDPATLAAWGADRAVTLTGTSVEEDVAASLTSRFDRRAPWAVLVPGTLWGREVAARVAAALGAGLTGDAVGFAVDDGRLVSWKPAFGGRLVAAITALSPTQMATVRPGILPLRTPRPSPPDPPHGPLPLDHLAGSHLGRVTVIDHGRDDDVAALLAAEAVVCVGAGVDPADYRTLDPLLAAVHGQLAATRKVTDQGWLPRARQVGLTGHAVAPTLLVAIGLSGKFNHMVGTRGAGTVVAINTDRGAPVFTAADVGLVGDWRTIVPLLATALT